MIKQHGALARVLRERGELAEGCDGKSFPVLRVTSYD
jgi:hypothetical protein